MPAPANRCEKFDRSVSYRKPAWFNHLLTPQIGHRIYLSNRWPWCRRTPPSLPDHPQDVLPSRNRAFMGSHSPQGVHHDHHPRPTATCRTLVPVTQNTRALARQWDRSKVHSTAWQGHLPSVRHRSLRKRVPRFVDCRVPESWQTVASGC